MIFVENMIKQGGKIVDILLPPPHMCISDLISYLCISIFKHFYNSKITLSRFRKF